MTDGTSFAFLPRIFPCPCFLLLCISPFKLTRCSSYVGAGLFQRSVDAEDARDPCSLPCYATNACIACSAGSSAAPHQWSCDPPMEVERESSLPSKPLQVISQQRMHDAGAPPRALSLDASPARARPPAYGFCLLNGRLCALYRKAGPVLPESSSISDMYCLGAEYIHFFLTKNFEDIWLAEAN